MLGAHGWGSPNAPLLVRYARDMGTEGRTIWIDGTANLKWLIDRAKVHDFCQNAARVGFNELVFDVKPVSGQVLYKSAIAEPMTQWKGVQVPGDYDILQILLEEAHAVGLKVSASVNVFSEGHKLVPGAGVAYSHPSWQMITYVASRYLSIPGDSISVERLNAVPVNDQVSVYTEGKAPAPKPETAERTLYIALNPSLQVAGIVWGNFVTEGIDVPDDWLVIMAVGSAAERFKNLTINTQVSFTGKPTFKPIVDSDTEGVAVFVNPLHPEVRSRELALIQEVTANYPIDGIVLDRMRYSNIHTDFSDITRQAFEMRYGKLGAWPQDIMEIDPMPGRSIKPGRLFSRWMEFRASVIRDFLTEAKSTVRLVKPNLPVGVYVGSWYDSYHEVGVNWASDLIDPPYEWASSTYRFTGYAGNIDFLYTGCYYKIPFAEDAPLYDADEGATVEASARRSVQLSGDSTFVYPSVYVLLYENDPQGLTRALQAAMGPSAGVMVFDASYVVDWNLWEIFAGVFKSSRPQAPHHYPSLSDSLRRLGDVRDNN